MKVCLKTLAFILRDFVFNSTILNEDRSVKRLPGLAFSLQSYEWLVVNQAGTDAQFKGTGMINGALDPNDNAYRFMLWAGDGSLDTFCIRIWWEDANGSMMCMTMALPSQSVPEASLSTRGSSPDRIAVILKEFDMVTARKNTLAVIYFLHN